MPTPLVKASDYGATSHSAVDFDLKDESLLLNNLSFNTDSGESETHELRTAPIFTREAYLEANLGKNVLQYGVLGTIMSIRSPSGAQSPPTDRRLYVNTNAPFSAVVCGVQGSGKSHTVSVLLESMFIPNCPATGELKKPLSGLVLHFGETGSSSRPCEVAFLGASQYRGVQPPDIRVYVSPSSLNRMTALYAPLGKRVQVEPLYLSESELDASAFLSMMAIGSSEAAPLYIQTVKAILRTLGEKYTYTKFLNILETKKKTFNPAQLSGIQQRLDLLMSFTSPNIPKTASKSRFCEGRITIIDLSDPFIDSSSACGLFEILLRLFERADVSTGKVLVVDEAHKYLSESRAASGLTKALLTLIRQQRHMAMRVVLSTQEPTIIPPVFIELSSLAIMHRFSSSAWWNHLAKHVSADLSGHDTFDQIVKLKTGEAIVLAPSGLAILEENNPSTGASNGTKRRLGQLGRRSLLIKTRKRVTKDGGMSILTVDGTYGFDT
ncbi:hypothetical protein HETIRDRAFT_473230 [Heterobasidion irregulare TC 32-1]|uniref:Zona occludens toxin N-terminal domain-containing protein n=1 Tax=Heterobasidion irregulare (strain TC 32-1) TaxID=747525 RepID=W4KGV5_HETIT|nr:uncharacterized protein HETIRDRAFT_473230 [Heterobasidion irregulare TC 32-1]ETW84550.1 hypothetical protein HETIRDRAFT_473230 [Heterobasidion irregulare TC 32-1]